MNHGVQEGEEKIAINREKGEKSKENGAKRVEKDEEQRKLYDKGGKQGKVMKRRSKAAEKVSEYLPINPSPFLFPVL